MGFFSDLFSKKTPTPDASLPPLTLAESSRVVSEEVCGDGDAVYHMSFRLNDAFRPAKSHAAEAEMLHTYAPGEDCGHEGDVPYLAIQIDDPVYCAVAAFKETGRIPEATMLTSLSGRFLFRAIMPYYDDLMYCYGLDRCDGFWENSGLCLVYPRGYAGTENERLLMRVLDEAAESYGEERIS